MKFTKGKEETVESTTNNELLELQTKYDNLLKQYNDIANKYAEQSKTINQLQETINQLNRYIERDNGIFGIIGRR